MKQSWPEFVKEAEPLAPQAVAARERTGWETVVFELTEDQDAGGSDFSTAAIAP